MYFYLSSSSRSFCLMASSQWSWFTSRCFWGVCSTWWWSSCLGVSLGCSSFGWSFFGFSSFGEWRLGVSFFGELCLGLILWISSCLGVSFFWTYSFCFEVSTLGLCSSFFFSEISVVFFVVEGVSKIL